MFFEAVIANVLVSTVICWGWNITESEVSGNCGEEKDEEPPPPPGPRNGGPATRVVDSSSLCDQVATGGIHECI